MAWIKVIDEAEATGELKTIYEDLAAKRGKVANIMKIHSLNPASMKAHLDLYLKVMFSKSGLSRAEREMIAVVVSNTNRCAYCVTHHSMALNFYWKDEKRLKNFISNYRAVVEDRRQLAMLDYARKLTENPAAVEEKDIALLREQGFDDTNILNINLIVSYFNFVNRIAEGLDVQFTPEEASGYKF